MASGTSHETFVNGMNHETFVNETRHVKDESCVHIVMMRQGGAASFVMFVLSWLLVLPFVVSFNVQPVLHRKSLRRAHFTVCQAATSQNDADGGSSNISSSVLAGKTVLVVGGSGRVGGSVVTQLVQSNSHVTVGGTSADSFQAAKSRNTAWTDDTVNFAVVNKEDADSITSILNRENYDLVVHTAGPFQGKATATNGVLEACVASKVPYVDVCDDYCTAMAAKAKYASKAQENNVSCIISTGCWVSFAMTCFVVLQ